MTEHQQGAAGNGCSTGCQKSGESHFFEFALCHCQGYKAALTAVPPCKEAIFASKIARKSPYMSPIFDCQSADGEQLMQTACFSTVWGQPETAAPFLWYKADQDAKKDPLQQVEVTDCRKTKWHNSNKKYADRIEGRFRASKAAQSRRGESKSVAFPRSPRFIRHFVAKAAAYVWRLWIQGIALN